MVVAMAYSRSEETYFVFRENGVEIEVVIRDNKIIFEKPSLTNEEKQWFLDKKFLEIKNKY